MFLPSKPHDFVLAASKLSMILLCVYTCGQNLNMCTECLQVSLELLVQQVGSTHALLAHVLVWYHTWLTDIQAALRLKLPAPCWAHATPQVARSGLSLSRLGIPQTLHRQQALKCHFAANPCACTCQPGDLIDTSLSTTLQPGCTLQLTVCMILRVIAPSCATPCWHPTALDMLFSGFPTSLIFLPGAQGAQGLTGPTGEWL